MSPLVVAAFPGLLFSVHPPAKQKNQPAPTPVVIQHQEQPLDSCSTYIYLPNSNKMLYFKGQPVTVDMLNKLGPFAEPFVQGLNQCTMG